MMNSGSNSRERAADLCNEPDVDLDSWINELYSDDFGDPLLNFCLDDIPVINLDFVSQPNMCTVNSGSISGGGSPDKSQSGTPQEMMTMSSLIPSSSTSTLQPSGHIPPPVPKFIPNPGSQSSQSRRTTDMPQFTKDNRRLKQKVIEHNVVQQPPTHPSMTQSTIMIGQQQNNQQMSLDQIRPCQRPVSTIKTIHLQNQQPLGRRSITRQLHQGQQQMVQPLQNIQQNHNQTQMQFQQHAGTSHILIPEGGQHRAQGLVIGEEQMKPEEHVQVNISVILSGPSGFLTPGYFSSNRAWRGYAFRQVLMLKKTYLSELLKMHKRAVQLCSQETNTEIARKYENAKEFLEKIITFLNIPTADMIPKNNVRVYNYLNFIVKYLHTFQSKNGGLLENFDPINPQPVHQPPDSQPNGPQLQSNNLPANMSHGAVNLETNMLNFNQQPVHQPASSQKGPQMQPNGDMKLQYMPPTSSSHGIANREATMMNFNQNFPSRRPQGRMTSPLSNIPFQMGTVNATPLRIGSSKGPQPNVLGTTQRSNLGPKTSTVNVSTSSKSLLNAATTGNFPSRQLNHQQSLVNQSFNSEKMKQPMYKANEMTSSNVGQAMSPLTAMLQNQFHSPQFSPQPSQKQPMVLYPAPHNSASSWQVNANNVLSPESIARSPFLLGSSSAPSRHEKQSSSYGPSSGSPVESPRPEIPIIGLYRDQNRIKNQISDMGSPRTPFLLGSSPAPSGHEKQSSSSGPSSGSPVESPRPEIPIIGLFRDQHRIKNQISDMGSPRTPTASPMDTPCTEKSKESQDSKEPHLLLTKVYKSSSSKPLGSSAISVDSVQQDLDSIPDHGEPTKPVGDIENITNFLMKCDDMEREDKFNNISDDEPANLDHLNIGDEIAFLFAPQPERKVKRKLGATSDNHSLPDFSDYDLDQFFSEDWDIDSTVTSMKKKSKVECKNGAILEEIKDVNSKLLETSLEIVNPSEASKSMVGGHENIIVNCKYRNVCFPNLFHPQAGLPSEMRPEFRIKLLLPVNYPASSPTIIKGNYYNVMSAPWPQLYEESVSKFNRAVCELPGPISLRDVAQNWDACARSVITEFVQQRGGKSYSTMYGSWASSSGSN